MRDLSDNVAALVFFIALALIIAVADWAATEHKVEMAKARCVEQAK